MKVNAIPMYTLKFKVFKRILWDIRLALAQYAFPNDPYDSVFKAAAEMSILPFVLWYHTNFTSI